MTAIAWLGVGCCVAFTLLVDACLDPDRRAAMRAAWGGRSLHLRKRGPRCLDRRRYQARTPTPQSEPSTIDESARCTTSTGARTFRNVRSSLR
jgi:hypothetical protein